MKVALHAGQLLQRVPGGIARYVEGLMGSLPDAGISLSAFAAGRRPDESMPGGVPWTDLGLPRGPLRYELWHRLRRPRLHLDADIVHAPSLAVPPAGKARLVVTVHDIAFLRHPEAFTRHGVEFHRRGLEVAYREAVAVIAASSFAVDELVRTGFSPERVHLAPHGVHIPPAPRYDDVRARLERIAILEPFVLVVGTVEPRKGLDVLTAAYAIVRKERPTLTLAIAGYHGWLEVPGLDAPGIRLVGRVDELTLDALYRRAQLCAVPSRYEGFGLPALEAMARGCPVVASDSSSLPEVVGNAGRLVPPDDVDAWAAAILSLLDDRATRTTLGDRGRDRASSFSWEESARAHCRAYDAALEMTARS